MLCFFLSEALFHNITLEAVCIVMVKRTSCDYKNWGFNSSIDADEPAYLCSIYKGTTAQLMEHFHAEVPQTDYGNFQILNRAGPDFFLTSVHRSLYPCPCNMLLFVVLYVKWYLIFKPQIFTNSSSLRNLATFFFFK